MCNQGNDNDKVIDKKQLNYVSASLLPNLDKPSLIDLQEALLHEFMLLWVGIKGIMWQSQESEIIPDDVDPLLHQCSRIHTLHQKIDIMESEARSLTSEPTA